MISMRGLLGPPVVQDGTWVSLGGQRGYLARRKARFEGGYVVGDGPAAGRKTVRLHGARLDPATTDRQNASYLRHAKTQHDIDLKIELLKCLSDIV